MVRSYVLFTTPTCPACPSVKSFLSTLEVKSGLNGENVDVTTDSGSERAVKFGISKAPTVILFDENKNELGRAHNINEIKSIIYDY